jgi:hypothetical protein
MQELTPPHETLLEQKQQDRAVMAEEMPVKNHGCHFLGLNLHPVLLLFLRQLVLVMIGTHQTVEEHQTMIAVMVMACQSRSTIELERVMATMVTLP